MTGSSNLSPSGRPRVTVAAIVEQHGQFLFVEEKDSSGKRVINQPAGHVEFNESLLDAVIRETLEETGRTFQPQAIIGIYLWGPPSAESQYLRICFSGTAGEPLAHAPLDPDITQTLWLSRDELETESQHWRSPLVPRCVDDYLAGERYPLNLLKSLLTA